MKISEVSKLTGFSTDTLRYYERIGLIAHVQRNNHGVRDFQESDLKRIEFIKCMRQAGIPINALNSYIALVQQGDATIDERKDILIKQRDHLRVKIEEMQETLDLLNYKIQVYEDLILKAKVDLLQTEKTTE